MASSSGSHRSWFEHLSLAPAPLLRLFCFPYAGGSTDVFRAWQRWFPPQIDVCLVHLPGRGKGMREPPFTNATSLVNAIADRIACETDVPYALYGHSMGAMIGFELARELLCRFGTGPQHLLVSGNKAPQWPKKDVTFSLPYDEFVAKIRKLNGTPPEVLGNPEFMELFIDLLRADFEVVDTYEYRFGQQLSCPITVYGGLQDEHVPPESCRAWQEQTSTACTVRMFNGDHFFVRNPGHEFVNAFRNDVLRSVPTSPL